MDSSRREVEVKLSFDSPAAAKGALHDLGARPVTPREFEGNVLFERRDDPLKPQQKLLRLRRIGERSLVTFKAPVPGEFRHKVRREDETAVADPDAMERVFEGLGFSPTFRYEKYRSTFEVDGLHVCLDETPLGCFVELEGEPEAIDRVAARLGFPPERYIRLSYIELHEQRAAERGESAGDMVFDPAGEGAPS